MFLQNLSGEHEEWRFEKAACGMILSSKTANSLNQWDTNSSIFPTSKNFWIPTVALGCSKVEAPGFNLSEKEVGMVKKDIIIRYSFDGK